MTAPSRSVTNGDARRRRHLSSTTERRCRVLPTRNVGRRRRPRQSRNPLRNPLPEEPRAVEGWEDADKQSTRSGVDEFRKTQENQKQWRKRRNDKRKCNEKARQRTPCRVEGGDCWLCCRNCHDFQDPTSAVDGIARSPVFLPLRISGPLPDIHGEVHGTHNESTSRHRSIASNGGFTSRPAIPARWTRWVGVEAHNQTHR